MIFLFGAAFALLNGTALFKWMDDLYNPVFWNEKDIPTADIERFKTWIYGVLGAVMAGWGVMLAFIAHYPFRNRERWSWNCVALGLAIWFLADTSVSLYFRVYINALFNFGIFAAVVLPLTFTRKAF